MGTAGALRLANYWGYWRRTALIINGDLLTDMVLTPILKCTGSSIALIRKTMMNMDYGNVEWESENGTISAFREKDNIRTDHPWINAGVYALSPLVLKYFPAKNNLSLEKDVFPGLAQKRLLYGVPVDTDHWVDIGVPERFLEAQNIILSKGRGMDGLFQIKPGVYCERQVIIGENCCLNPPLLIRRDTWIGNGVHLGPNTVVGENCRIGAESILESVYLGPHSWIGSRSELIAVLAERRVNLGEGVRIKRYVLGDGTRFCSENQFF